MQRIYWKSEGILELVQMSESFLLAEGETIFQEQSKIADILLNNHFLSGISAPAVPDPKNHHSIFTIKNNFSPTEVFNFSPVSVGY